MNKSRHKPNKIHTNHIIQIVPCKTALTLANFTNFTFKPMWHFYTPWKQKAISFLRFSDVFGIEMEHWLKIGYMWRNNLLTGENIWFCIGLSCSRAYMHERGARVEFFVFDFYSIESFSTFMLHSILVIDEKRYRRNTFTLVKISLSDFTLDSYLIQI